MTHIERCDDKKCKGYGKQFVDRGYGYPVCPSNRPSLNSVPMNPKYYGQYKKEDIRSTYKKAEKLFMNAISKGWDENGAYEIVHKKYGKEYADAVMQTAYETIQKEESILNYKKLLNTAKTGKI